MDAEAWRIDGFDEVPPDDLAARIWERDPSVWGPGNDDPRELKGRQNLASALF